MSEKNKKLNKKLISGIILVAVLFMAFAPLHQAKAVTLPEAIATATVSTSIAMIMNLIKGAEVWLTSLLASGVNKNLSVTLTNQDAVTQSWEIMRNFANMMFIIALIMMAFGTIFNIGGYNISSLIGRFLVAALLINFSLVIGQIIIDWTQALSNVFIQAIGDIGAQVAGSLNPGTLFTEALTSNIPLEAVLWKSVILQFANIILLSIAMFSMAVLYFFTFIRIPMLWGLLIMSPIAWITYILPTTKDINKRWWNEFIGWNIFLPIYLFFIYFGLFFLKGQNLITSNSPTELDKLSLDLFRYGLVAMFLIGGAKAAMSAKVSAGAGGWAAWTWGKGAAGTRLAGSRLYRATGIPARQAALEEKLGEYQKKGLPGRLGKIYGGEEALQRRGAGIAQRYGAQETADKQMGQAVGSARQRLQKITDNKELEQITISGKDNEKIAALELLSERQGLNGEQAAMLYNLYGGSASQNARKALEKLDVKKFTKDERDRLYNEIGDVRFKQKIADVRAERGDFREVEDFINQSTIFSSEADKGDYVKKAKDYLERLKPEQRKSIFDNANATAEMKRELATVMADKGDFKQAPELITVANLYETANQKESILNKAKKKHLAAVLRAKESLQLLSPGDTYETAMTKEVRRLDNETLLELSVETLRDTTFQTELKKTLTPKRITAISTSPKLSGEESEVLKGIFFSMRSDMINEEKIKPLGKYTDRIKTLVNEITSAKEDKNIDKAGQLLIEAEAIFKKSKKLSEEILTSDSATSLQQETTRKQMQDITAMINSLKSQK